ncbi:MAG: dihydrodipicolinate synthase family protein [Acidimicrobiales bacterium]
MGIDAMDPFGLVRPRRAITGMSAVLLPFTDDGAIDWPSFESLVARVADAGLVPAVNMDTGFVNLLSEDERRQVLDVTSKALAARSAAAAISFAAGAVVDDHPGDAVDLDGYARAAAQIQEAGGTPVIFPSYGLGGLAGPDVVSAHERLAEHCDRFLAFELSTEFAPFGRIHDLETYEGLLAIDACIGAKHSSLRRADEWQRLQLRDRVRPDFWVLTGNDRAIDMVMYGSDYLLGLAMFAPDAFAHRDALWAAGDPAFHEVNDLLQYLGQFAFRAPVPAYRHSAAQLLALRGWLPGSSIHPDSPRRPDSDVEVLREVLDRLERVLP